MNRLYQLKETLPYNLNRILRYPELPIEFVVLNYNSQDGMDEWMREYFQPEINKGLIRYGHEKTVKYFHMSKAKNMAHRLASGNFLVNLDADNYLNDVITRVYNVVRTKQNVVFHCFQGIFGDGTHGRIGICKNWFEKLGGYDESFLPFCYEDTDFLRRAVAMGCKKIRLPSKTKLSMPNPRGDTAMFTEYPFLSGELAQEQNKAKSIENIQNGILKANPEGYGRGSVTINFTQEVEYK